MFGPTWLVPFVSFLSLTHAAPSSVFQSVPPWEPCPVQCGLVGSDPQNWGVYHDLEALNRCTRPMLMNFAVKVPLNKPNAQNKIQACSIWGDSIAESQANSTDAVFLPDSVTVERVQYGTASGDSREGARALYYLRTYLDKQVQASESNSILFVKSAQTVVGFFGGSQLNSSQIAESVVPDILGDVFVNKTSRGVLEQICGADRSDRQTWGVVVSFDGSLSAVRDTVHTWANGTCVDFEEQPSLITALSASPSSSSSSSSRNITIHTSSGDDQPTTSTGTSDLQRRATCSTIQVNQGEGCPELAVRCGITAAQFTSYNSDSTLCSSLLAGMHVCCSSGTRPDYTPAKNSDGSCHTYSVVTDDTCSQIAAANDLTIAKLETYNKNTWGWNGCDLPLWVGTVMCLSAGTPPMPAAVANAVCGPQVPGTTAPTDGTALADLNPCPLNACCDIWGQCGTTDEFCTESDSDSGAPGTAAEGKNGCISNCGTSIVTSAAPASFQKIAYFEGYNLGRTCLNMDASQIDTDKYTHIHFGFGTLTEDFQVGVGDDRGQFEFERFKLIQGAKRVLSIGGWTFSTDMDTYMIFRNMVLPENRNQAAKNIADFINDNDLDGVDIDWEYPGATDTGPPPADDGEGLNYASFLWLLKGYLPNKSVSIAAPASFWYLKAFPIETIGLIVDYVVYMTYDLHGQWDFANQWAVPGCPDGNCLRSHVNITETLGALSMITKAGVASNKIYVGVSSYGRSFKMTTAGCTGPMCTFTGAESDALAGRCTATNGYISNAEINEIINTNPTAKTSKDASYSNILVYNNTEWVAYMNDDTKAERDTIYGLFNFAGTVDWAIDLAEFHSVPADAYKDNSDGSHVLLEEWADIKGAINEGTDPFTHGTRSGNWTTLTCSDPGVQGALDLAADDRWGRLDCQDAYDDAVQVYKDYYAKEYFTKAISTVYHGPEDMMCGYMSQEAHCSDIQSCTTSIVSEGSGPGAYLVLNSFIKIQGFFQSWYDAIGQASETVLYDVDNFLNKFAPIPDDTLEFNMLMDTLGLLIPGAMAPVFNSALKSTDYFTAHPGRLDTAKDIAFTLVGTWVNMAKDSHSSDYGWTEETQWEFKSFMGSVWDAWKNSTELTSIALFNGSDSSINLLGRMIKDGQLIEGASEGNTAAAPYSAMDMQKIMEKSFYSYVIPVLWQKAGTKAFVIDTGHACDGTNPVPDYVYDKDVSTAGVCFQDKQYFLMYPDGPADGCQLGTGSTSCGVTYKFSVPPGLDTMGQIFDGQSAVAWGGLLPIDIIGSTVNSYVANGNKNGWSLKSLSGYSDDPDITVQQLKDDGIIGRGVRTAGHNTIPMCSAEEAHMNWGVNTDLDNYPCNDP